METMCQQTNVEICNKMGGLVREFARARQAHWRDINVNWGRDDISVFKTKIKTGMKGTNPTGDK